MRYKLINVISICLMAFLLSGCGKNIDIAVITDTGTVTDKSINQGAYEGVVKYAEETQKKYAVYNPVKASNDSFLENIKTAVHDGADVVVCPGILFEEAVFTAQKRYPYVEFILIDGQPHDSSYNNYEIKENTIPVHFSEEQAGFLAGYSAVRDNNTELGYIGGAKFDYVERYGYGFVQGADYAAIEMGVNVNIKYYYDNSFFENEEVKKLACQWYSEGTQVIYTCSGLMRKSIFAAAEEADGKVIGVDINPSVESSTVMTSSDKNISNAIYRCLTDYYNESPVGGMIYEMNASNEGISLDMENSRFETFSQADYDKVYSLLANGGIVPYATTDYGNCADMELVNTVIDYQE